MLNLIWPFAFGKQLALVPYTFGKIKAHQTIDVCEDLLLKYERLGNQQANDAALSACQFMMPSLVKDANRTAHRLQVHHDILHEYFQYFLDLQRACAMLKKQIHQLDMHPPRRAGEDTICAKLSKYQPLTCWVMPTPTVDHSRDAAWGPTWAAQFTTWVQELQWPDTDNSVDYQDVGVTWVELAMSLMLHTGMWIPIRRRDRDDRERLIVFDTWDDLAGYQIRFSEFADTMSQMFTQFASLRDTPLHPPTSRKLVTSAYIQGFSIHSSGLALRPKLPCQEQLLHILQEHLTMHKGPAWTVIPQLPLPVDTRRTDMVRREVTGLWCDRCRMSQLSAQKVRSYIRLALRPITFHS